MADQVVEEAVRHALSLIMAARSQQGRGLPQVQRVQPLQPVQPVQPLPHVPRVREPVKVELPVRETLGVDLPAGWSSVASIYEQLSTLQRRAAD